MKKMKVIIPVLIVVFVLVAAFGAIGSGAWYKDTGTSAGNVITGGTLDLTIDDNNGATVPMKMSASKLAPGAWDNIGAVTIKNIGNLPGKLSINLNNISNIENTILAPEAAAGDTTADVGELGPMIGISAQENVAPYTRYAIMSGLSNGATLSTEGRVLQPGESIQIVFYAVWTPTSNDNVAQGDSVNFNATFVLDQIH